MYRRYVFSRCLKVYQTNILYLIIYDESRQAYIIWNSYNRPRSGPVHEPMKRTRARFNYAQRLVQKNEDMLRADALAKKLSSGDAKCFWKNVKTATQEQ